MRGRHHPDVHGDGARRPHPSDLPLLQRAEQLRLRGRRQVADLVEEEGAAAGGLEEPLPVPVRAGEGSLHVPEELALDQLGGEGRAVQRHEGAPAAGALGVERPRRQLLPGPALAPQQHAHVGGPGAADEMVRLAHRGGVADQPAELARELLPQPSVLAAQRQHLPRPPRHRADLLVVEGLGDVVVRPELEGPHRDPLVAVRRHEHEEGARMPRAHLLQELHAVHRRHAEVGDHQVGLLALQRAERCRGVLHRPHLVPLLLQELGEGEADRALVVHHQDPHRATAAGRSGADRGALPKRAR